MRRCSVFLIIALVLSAPVFSSQLYEVSSVVTQRMEEMLSQRDEDFSSLDFEILFIESDDQITEGHILVSSDILFSADGRQTVESLMFYTDSPDVIAQTYRNEFEKILPSVLNSLYDFKEDDRLFYQNGAPLSGTSGSEDIRTGSVVVTRDSERQINGVMAVTDRIGSSIYMTSLWADTKYSDYMRIEKGPDNTFSVRPLFSTESATLNLTFSRRLFSLISYEIGFDALYGFTSRDFQVYLSGGLGSSLPLSLFFSPSGADRWFQKLSVEGSASVGIGFDLTDGYQMNLHGGICTSILYMIRPFYSLGLSVSLHSTAPFDDLSSGESVLSAGPVLSVRF